jgi:hypothetical protein
VDECARVLPPDEAAQAQYFLHAYLQFLLNEWRHDSARLLSITPRKA